MVCAYEDRQRGLGCWEPLQAEPLMCWGYAEYPRYQRYWSWSSLRVLRNYRLDEWC